MIITYELVNKINFVIKEDHIINKSYINNGFLYLTTLNKNKIGKKKDKRDSFVGGIGCLKFNLLNYDYEIVHYLDMPTELLDVSKSNPTTEQIILNIRNEKYIDEDDIFNFILNEYGEDLTSDYNFFELNELVIGISFKNRAIYDKFLNFFNRAGVKLLLNERCKILIQRECNDAPASL